MHSFQKISYSKLNSKQQENYNFHKASGILADYGFNSLRLNDDWQGADFIAIHINGKDVLRIQLKGGFALDKKYLKKNIYICFHSKKTWFIFPHDNVAKQLTRTSGYQKTKSWKEKGHYRFPNPSKNVLKVLNNYLTVEA